MAKVGFGSKVRCLPSAGRELGKREKLDASLRDGIVAGYREHSGGRWAEQYLVLDAGAYTEVPGDTARTAYVHGVSEICLPGSAGDGTEKPLFPVAEGVYKEARADVREDIVVAPSGANDPTNATGLTTLLGECQVSSGRPAIYLSDEDVYPGGTIGG